MLATFTNPTIFEVRRDLVPLPKLPHILYVHLGSSLDNRMMAYIQGRNMWLYIILYIATNCNIVAFMTVYIYIYTHNTALYY